MTNSKELTAEEDLGGYIQPKLDCIHVRRIKNSPSLEQALKAFEKGCEECGEKTENWYCLECCKVFCGRYVHGHMVEHAKRGHRTCISLEDLNTWCYKCDCYIKSDALTPHYHVLHLAKFGELPPDCQITHVKS